MSDSGERTQEATPLRLQQARAAGDSPHSHELAAALAMLGTLGVLAWFTADIGGWLSSWTRESWQPQTPLRMGEQGQIVERLQQLIGNAILALAPVWLLILLVAIAAHWIQTGPRWLPARLQPQLERVGPGTWLRHLRPGRLLGHLWLGLPKVVLGLAILGWSLQANLPSLFALGNLPADQMVSRGFAIVITIGLQVSGTLLLLGVADLGNNWWSFRKRLRMTDQELREELREQSGDAVNQLRQRQLNRVS